MGHFYRGLRARDASNGRCTPELLEQPAPTVARAVVVFDDLPLDASRVVEDEGHRIRDAVLLRPCGDAEPRVMRLEVVVQNAELPNDAAAFVGEQRVVDAVLVRERFQVRRAVMGDRNDGIPSASQLPLHALQLNQLRLAIRSPDRAAIEDDELADLEAFL